MCKNDHGGLLETQCEKVEADGRVEGVKERADRPPVIGEEALITVGPSNRV
jgi:hypothetical protein